MTANIAVNYPAEFIGAFCELLGIFQVHDLFIGDKLFHTWIHDMDTGRGYMTQMLDMDTLHGYMTWILDMDIGHGYLRWIHDMET